MPNKIILLTPRKLYHQTEELANALIREHDRCEKLEDEKLKLLEKTQELSEKTQELYDELDKLHSSYMQLLDENRSLEYMNELLEGELEHCKRL